MRDVGSAGKTMRHFAGLAMIAMAAAGCSTTAASTRGAGGVVPVEVNSRLYIEALGGGLIARNTAVSLSAADRQRALEAEYRALEAAPGGQPVAWEGSGVKGQVVAAAPYQVGSQNCRQYGHTVTADGRETISRGAACRNPNGTWSPLT